MTEVRAKEGHDDRLDDMCELSLGRDLVAIKGGGGTKVEVGIGPHHQRTPCSLLHALYTQALHRLYIALGLWHPW